MVLTYATPVFYPETILPERFRGTLTFNPMYHFIRFFRTLVMDGVSPEPREYLQCAAISVVMLAAGLIVFKKALPIWCIKVYQRYAADDVRKRCLFTPSCSEYMILSIEKYGAVRGIIKGIKRLRRCHAPNGGEDYP